MEGEDVAGATMRLFQLLAAVAASFVLCASAALAGEWRVTQVKQPARYTTNSKTWTTIKRGMVLPRTSWIHTGRGGRLKLNRGSETIRFRPNTLASIQKRFGSGMTRITQRSGTLNVAVRKRRRPHMTVRTRHMTAVVKGTTFKVSHRRGGVRLSVRSGLVAVRSSAGQRMDVGRGQYAAVSASGAMRGTGGRPGQAARARKVKHYSGNVTERQATRSVARSTRSAPAPVAKAPQAQVSQARTQPAVAPAAPAPTPAAPAPATRGGNLAPPL